MGKSFDFTQSMVKALNIPDEVDRWGTILKCSGYGTWLLLDTIQWLQVTGVLSLDPTTMAMINQTAPRLWLLGIASSLLVNLHKIQKNFLRRQVDVHLLIQGAPKGRELLDGEMKKYTKDALQDLIDLIIPLSMLGWINVSPGTVGLAGTITSIMGATSLFPK